MKLNLNAKELLALHNLLFERFDGNNAGDRCYPETAEHVQLKQVYGRVKACIINSLSGNHSPGTVPLNEVEADAFDAWVAHEQAKIDDLKVQNEKLKFGVDIGAMSEADFLSVVDDPDYKEYPRSKAPSQRVSQKGKWQSNKK